MGAVEGEITKNLTGGNVIEFDKLPCTVKLPKEAGTYEVNIRPLENSEIWSDENNRSRFEISQGVNSKDLQITLRTQVQVEKLETVAELYNEIGGGIAELCSHTGELQLPAKIEVLLSNGEKVLEKSYTANSLPMPLTFTDFDENETYSISVKWNNEELKCEPNVISPDGQNKITISKSA